MKKSIIALAVAGAVTAPIVAQADATLYGRVHQRIIFAEDQDVNFQNAEARIGVKGSSQMDSGLTAFYNIEMSIRGDNASARQSNSSRTGSDATTYRQVHAGVKGDFGQIKVGRFTNPLVSTYTADIFEHKSGNYEAAPYRVGNALSYTTPSLGPVSLYGVIIGEGEGTDNTYNDVDAYVVGLDSSFGPVSANIAYMDQDYEDPATSDDKEIVSLGLAYSANNLYVGLNYEDTKDTADTIALGVTYAIGNTTLGAEYSRYDRDAAGAEESDLYRLAVYQNLGGKADAYAEIVNEDNIGGTKGNDSTDFVLGYRVKF